VIIDGFGAYTDLHGVGSLSGVNEDGVVTDVYVGAVHAD